VIVDLITKINPGVQFCNEIRVEYKDGSALTQMEYAHPHDSLGVFLETKEGQILKIPHSHNTLSSYTL
jgi:hypothetical protein